VEEVASFPQPKPLRLAIVGFGKMGQRHAKAFGQHAGCRVVGVTDIDLGKRDHAAALGLTFAQTLNDLPDTFDAVVIATPPQSHAGLAIPLLRAGVHCLVEKPLALNAHEAGAMHSAAVSGNAVLAVGHSERFNAGVENALEFLGTHDATIHVQRTSNPGERNDATDVLQDLMIHDLDWVINEEGHFDCDVEMLESEYHQGRLVHARCTLTYGQRRYEMIARHSNDERTRTIQIQRSDGSTREFDLTGHSDGVRSSPLQRQASAFVDVCNGKPAPLSTGQQALAVMDVIEKIQIMNDLALQSA